MAQLMTILVLIVMVFVIILEMFCGRISLNSVLLLLLENFVSGFRLKLMYIFLIVSIRSSLTHLHGIQQIVLLPQFIEIIFFHLHQQNKSSKSKVQVRQVGNIVAKGFLKLPNLHMLQKQKNPSLPRNLVLEAFGELLMVFSTKVNLPPSQKNKLFKLSKTKIL